MNDDGVLNWPVMFVYPEYGQTDFIQAFAEDVTLGSMLTEMFQERPPWDQEGKYKPEQMTLWIEHRKIQSIFQVDINAPLHAALRIVHFQPLTQGHQDRDDRSVLKTPK